MSESHFNNVLLEDPFSQWVRATPLVVPPDPVRRAPLVLRDYRLCLLRCQWHVLKASVAVCLILHQGHDTQWNGSPRQRRLHDYNVGPHCRHINIAHDSASQVTRLDVMVL